MPDSVVIAGLDVGSETVRAVVAEYDHAGSLKIAGIGTAPSSGLRKGVIVNIEAAASAIARAVEDAEHDAGRTVVEVWASLGGASVEGMNSRGVVAVAGKTREIGDADVARVIEAARAVVIPMDREIIHVLPQEFIIDDQGGVKDPLDMIGIRLEAEVHLITGSLSASRNLRKAVERGGYKVRDIAQGAWSAARAVLTEDEKELGTLFIDIGAGTTDYQLVVGGAPRLTGSLPVGGTQATNDLSIVLKTPLEAAERVKKESGCCWAPLTDVEEPVIIPGVGGRPPMPIPQAEICRILQPRMEEIFRIIRDDVARHGLLSRMGGGITLAGGGSLLSGAPELAGRVFELPARMAVPKAGPGWPDACRDPAWVTAAGLVVYGDVQETGVEDDVDEASRDRERPSPLKGLARWLGEFF